MNLPAFFLPWPDLRTRAKDTKPSAGRPLRSTAGSASRASRCAPSKRKSDDPTGEDGKETCRDVPHLSHGRNVLAAHAPFRRVAERDLGQRQRRHRGRICAQDARAQAQAQDPGRGQDHRALVVGEAAGLFLARLRQLLRPGDGKAEAPMRFMSGLIWHSLT